jgi:hypothetical protein
MSFAPDACWDCPVSLKLVIGFALASLLITAFSAVAVAVRHRFAGCIAGLAVLPLIYLSLVPVYFSRRGIALTSHVGEANQVIRPNVTFAAVWWLACVATAYIAFRTARRARGAHA